MKLLSGFVAVLLIVSASAEIPSAEKTVSDLENQWAEAQKTGNADVVAPMLADTFSNTDADGETYGKSQLLTNLKGGKWEVNGISDVQVKVYGNAAVATGSWTGKGVDGDYAVIALGTPHALRNGVLGGQHGRGGRRRGSQGAIALAR